MTREIEQFVLAGRKRYADEWTSGDAKKYEVDGNYEWMANFLPEKGNVFEIGTGDGRGTLQLVKHGLKVVSIDENTECLNIAQEKLEKNNLTVVRLKRESLSSSNKSNGAYSINYSEISEIKKDYDVLLIEGDILGDDKLFEWLESKPDSYVAVVCWLIGTHYSRGRNEVIDHQQMATPLHYRIFVQNIVYEISDIILKSGGLLHVVDRGPPLINEEMVLNLKAFHEDQASVTSLVVKSIESKKYSEPTNGVGMCHTITEHTKHIPEDFTDLYLHSVISIKP